MSKNIIIQKNGVDQTLTGIEKLRTQKIGGGACDWIPMDEAHGGTLFVGANGTYAASADGVRGYTNAVVRVSVNRVTGKGADGNLHVVGVDENGYFTDLVVPSYISVTTLPDTTTYEVGDTISYTGIVVTAYDENGVSMGDVDNEELIFTVTTASAGLESVPVKWPRPGDLEILETSFEITVT